MISNKTLWLSIFTILLIVSITTIIECWIYQDNYEWEPEWTKTLSTVMNNTEYAYRCCEITDCECVNTPDNTPLCSQMNINLIDGVCDNGKHCCKHKCDRCCTNVCNDDGPCYKHCYDCNCECAKKVNHQKCYNKCGTCWNFFVYMSYPTKNNEIHYYSFIGHCGLNNLDCVFNSQDIFKINNTITGWYKNANPNKFTLKNPDEGWKIGAGMITVLVILSVGLFITFCILVHNIMKSDGRRTYGDYYSSL